MTTERDIKNQIAFAQEKGFELGRAEGEASGLARGQAEGKAEGRADAARNFKRLGVDESIICQATGLSVEEVAAL